MDLKTRFTPFPVLSTPRLDLRALRSTDLDDLYAYASDPEIDRFTPWTHYESFDEARANLDEFLAEYEQHDGCLGHRAPRRPALNRNRQFQPPAPYQSAG